MADGKLPNAPPPPYASLINNGLIDPIVSRSLVRVNWHYFLECHRVRVEAVAFNGAWYLDRYPDIQEAIDEGSFASAAEHYQEFGYYEHRMPYLIEVDEVWYLNEYPDIAKAVAQRMFPTGQAHFEELGFKEGRMPFRDFRFKARA